MKMTPECYLGITVTKNLSQGYVFTPLRPSDLELSFEDFCYRYLKPAYEEAKRQMDILLEVGDTTPQGEA